jgi:sarcosine oxidase subunit beta
MKQVTDVVVIGSGATGCAVAFFLAQARVRVTLVEKGSLVNGMTRRNAGLAHTHQLHPATARLAAASLNIFHQWMDRVGSNSSFVETGLVAFDDNADALRERVAMQQNAGVETHLLDRRELQTLYPNARFDDVSVAAYERRSGYADAVQTAQSFAQRAREKGARFETGTLVKSIGTERSRIINVATTTGNIETPIVIVAAGGWSERLLRPLGVALNLHYTRGEIAFFERPSNEGEPHPIFLDAARAMFLRPHAFHLSAAGKIDNGVTSSGPDYLGEDVSRAATADLARFAADHLPALVDAPLKRAHAIQYDQPPDARPALGAVSGIEGLFVAAGFGENAFTLAPAVGETLAEWIVDGQPRTDVSELNPRRASITE